MRTAINENRTVQLVLVGILALVGGFLLLKSKGGGDETAAAPPAASTATTGAIDPTTGAPVSTDMAAATGATAPTAAPTAAGATVPANMVPGPGLPKSLLSAYRDGDAIALLVRRAGGLDDALVHDSVGLIRSLPDVKLYVTKARHIARYTWLTQGVNVTDLPALVVLRPRKLTKGTPTAAVSYGFRDGASVLQAVEDGLYRGPTDRPYHP